jgi:hypothetical protein
LIGYGTLNSLARRFEGEHKAIVGSLDLLPTIRGTAPIIPKGYLFGSKPLGLALGADLARRDAKRRKRRVGTEG